MKGVLKPTRFTEDSTGMLLGLALTLLLSFPTRLHGWSNHFHSLSSKPSTPTTTTTTTAAATAARLSEVSLQATRSTTSASTHYFSALLDGPCWMSLKRRLQEQQPPPPPQTSVKGHTQNFYKSQEIVGHLQLVSGVLPDGSRVVGMPAPATAEEQESPVLQLESGDELAADSVAYVPDHVKSLEQAALTYSYLLTHVYPLLDKSVTNVGGSRDSLPPTPPNHAVIVGGNTDAVQAAQALQILGSPQVTIVSTEPKKVKVPALQQKRQINSSKEEGKISVVDPSMGELGFSKAIGKFDALLDTIGNELKFEDQLNGRNNNGIMASSVVSLLQKEHDCSTYMTTFTKAQEIINREGVLWGPGKVKEYHESLVQQNQSQKNSISTILSTPPHQIGKIVQTVLDAGLVWSAPQDGGNQKNGGGFFNVMKKPAAPTTDRPHVRGWDMPRFMENTMWPIDNRGTGTIRYGFPVPGKYGSNSVDDDEEDDKLTFLDFQPENVDDEEEQDDDDNEDYRRISEPPAMTAEELVELVATQEKHVVQVESVRELEQKIARPQLDCVLFLSAKFCRACKKMQLPYSRMARVNNEVLLSMANDDDDGNNDKNSLDTENSDFLVFAQGEASGQSGKLLGRALGVDAVPTFILFKNGQQYGEPLSITRLPSEKLEKAINNLKAGKPWDKTLLSED